MAIAVAPADRSAAAVIGLGTGKEASHVAGLLFDEAIPQSAAFAAYGRKHGIPLHGYRTDPAHIWLQSLRRQLASGGALAGMTSQGALFFLERMAWDVGLRLMLRIDHVEVNENWQHASPGILSEAVQTRLRMSHADFGACMAELVTTGPAILRDCTYAAPPLAQSGDASTPVSWVLARPSLR